MEKNYILDSNILFSALISQKVFYLQLFRSFRFYTPEFILEELSIYEKTIENKSNVSKRELQSFALQLFSEIRILPNILLTIESVNQAKELCRNIDLKDAAFVALAIQLDYILLTRDKKLYDGLKKQGFENVMSFDQFVQKNILPE